MLDGRKQGIGEVFLPYTDTERGGKNYFYGIMKEKQNNKERNRKIYSFMQSTSVRDMGGFKI